MGLFDRLKEAVGITPAAAPAPAPMREAASAQGSDEPGWRRLSGDGLSSQNDRDLSPMAQDRMQKVAEYLWQSNLLANRLVELPLAYLLAEGVTLQCKDEEHQKLIDAFWRDPINNWPLKLTPRVRALGLMGEQCYIANVRDGDGFVRLGYLDPRQIATVVTDPENPEQPIGVVTKRDNRGKQHKYRVIVLGEDSELFSANTARIRAEDFQDGECLLYQLNKFPNGSRGRSDLLGQIDWLDAYDEFLFNELDRIGYLRAFVWDVTLNGADPKAVEDYEKTFTPPAPNSSFVHNDSVKLEAKSPSLQAAETSESARLLRNHVLGGSTTPEHWFGGGGDVNRAAASEMGEPTFKIYTGRQNFLKLALEEIGRFVLWKAAQASGEKPDWAEDKWQVTAVFPELVNRDVTKFAAAMASLVSAVIQMIDAGLLTQETALKLVADVAQRFGQDFDAKTELEAARKEAGDRKAKSRADDSFNLSPEEREALRTGRGVPVASNKPSEDPEPVPA
ncbi:phage portal protein [Hydrogenophaga taeniospiralis]|uniref:phage portal protein n=1 Tax=Hydrogenophaga taeniospiralis TaxID=65656 RepID=UPI001CFA8695|nr:phage portal protein [Hydrogenophaga taeniospiralis]